LSLFGDAAGKKVNGRKTRIFFLKMFRPIKKMPLGELVVLQQQLIWASI
jgi:hypothetical protein